MMNRGILNPTLYSTTTPPEPIGEGIYHSTELGLISLSVDGTTRYTIADKNLGASSLGGNGLYYQRGNNYGFGSGNYVWQQRVDATNYGPYYNSDTFVISNNGRNDWSNPTNNNLWGEITDTNEARRGPCPEGFHIPSRDENYSITRTMFDLGIGNSGIPLKRYLYMPYAGSRGVGSGREGMPISQGETGEYWSTSSPRDREGNARYINDGTSDASGNWKGKSNGCSIRPMKNESVTPDNTRTTLYQGSGNAGIFRSAELGVISLSSNGTTRITIADKNLGATRIYQDGEELSQANCGGYFQWGNNYMFPFTGDITTSTERVDASNYGPYYYSSDFIGTYTDMTYNWSSVTNKNLWGGITNTDIAKRGPCPEGFHIPTMLEESEFERNLGILGGSIGTIYMPKTGLMYPNMSVYDRTFRGVWTSQRAEGGSTPYFRGNFYRSYGAGRGMQIRPFKDTPVVPDSTRTKLY